MEFKIIAQDNALNVVKFHFWVLRWMWLLTTRLKSAPCVTQGPSKYLPMSCALYAFVRRSYFHSALNTPKCHSLLHIHTHKHIRKTKECHLFIIRKTVVRASSAASLPVPFCIWPTAVWMDLFNRFEPLMVVYNLKLLLHKMRRTPHQGQASPLTKWAGFVEHDRVDQLVLWLYVLATKYNNKLAAITFGWRAVEYVCEIPSI